MKFHEEKNQVESEWWKMRGNYTYADTLHISMVPTKSSQRSFKLRIYNYKEQE